MRAHDGYAKPFAATKKKKTKQLQKDKITTKNLNRQIKEATIQLLEMAKEHSWNKISSNVRYVIKKVKTEITECENLFQTNRIRKRLLSLKERLNYPAASGRGIKCPVTCQIGLTDCDKFAYSFFLDFEHNSLS